MKKIILLFAICNLQSAICNLFAQDIHFSQFYQAPLLLNPALTAVFPGDMRAIINYKDQWRSIASPYQTTAFSYDAGLFKKKWKNSYLGAGLFVFNDKAGDSKLGITQVNLSLSSVIYLSEKQKASVGLQGGYAQKSINPANLQWDNQYNGANYDPSISGESLKQETFSFNDFSTGVSWSYGTDESSLFKNNVLKINVGAAYHHLNRPQQNFGTTERLYSKLVVHTGAYIGLGNSNTALIPSFQLINQGPTREINFGGMVRYTLKEESKYTGLFKETAILLGGYFRLGDAIIPSVMFEIANFAMGVTYDVNVSTLKTVSNLRGGTEFSLQFISPSPFGYGRKTSKSVRFL